MSSSSSRKITLMSSDGESFQVEEAVALQFDAIKDRIEVDTDADVEIPILNVKSNILTKVIEYAQKHSNHAAAAPFDEELKNWDSEFVKVDQTTLFDLVLAANYLNIKGLLDLASMRVAEMIKGKTQEEIRRTFNINDNFTPEEEEEVRRQNL